MAAFVVLAGGLALAVALWGGRPVVLPVWAVAETEARVNRLLDGHAAVALGGVELSLDGIRAAGLRLEDLRVMAPDGRLLAQLPELTAAFDAPALLKGDIHPEVLRLVGAQVTLRRAADGTLDLGVGEGMLGSAGAATPGALLDVLGGVFDLPALRQLERIEAEAVTLTLDDRRARRVWTAGDGRLSLTRDDAALVLEAGLGLVAGGSAHARAQMSVVMDRASGEARVAVGLDQVAARDLAAVAPVLGWLGVLEATFAGELRASLDAAGALTGLDGALSSGAGALQPTPGAAPIAFDRAGLRFAYDPAAERINFSELAVESATLRLKAAGHSYLDAIVDGRPGAFIGQVQITEMRIDPEGMLTEPLRFTQGALDARLRLDPFELSIGQLSLVGEGHRLLVAGGVSAGEAGWTVTVDVDMDEIAHDRLLALWPVRLVPRTRAWLEQNVQEGRLFDVKGALRIRPGQEPRLTLGYEFAGADVRILRTLPPIRDGFGYATVQDNTYTMVLDRGHVTPPEGGDVAVGGSVFRVPDITQKPAQAHITLKTDSTITAALSMLDQPPFGFMSKAGVAVDMAEGRAVLTTEMDLPLLPKVQVSDVDYRVGGELREVATDRMAPGRRLAAPVLALQADPRGITIAGQGTIGALPFSATWRQDFGPGTAGISSVAGSVPLDGRFLSEFVPGIATNSLSGEGVADFTIALARDAPPRFTLTSTLERSAMRIAEIGWSKPAAASGRLEVAGTLGRPAVVDRLALTAPGLRAEGAVRLRAEGGLDRLSLDRLDLGDWLRAKAELVGQGAGRAAQVRVTGGTADLRRLPEGGAGGGGGAGTTLAVTLDRVQVTEGIALTDFRGDLGTRGGLRGTFAGRVNGAAPVEGRIDTTAAGTAFRVAARDAGAVMRAAGIFDKMRGGAMDLVLTPTGARGHYEGTVGLRSFRVRNLSVLADLLNAVSIVGLLEQLQTSGLAFSEASGRFRLTPVGMELREGAAVGASFGVTMEGLYTFANAQLDLRGVISPFYLVNGIGSVLTRRGEGVFGFNYRIRGTAEAPQVNVRLLSVLAPAFFRELFRKPPASLPE
ncbi:AsmA-like C-terminal region-containing protein [Xinfangfangia sp. LG-4]|uniref:AsmA-like C-terminal region-containing protein n=1 Tax=Ruixingdingia sedimenti TaxID=3073604 RepID=A0ABU1F3A5_9RHOB|nr:AsmA-like C-terminal region-containing protein [Xinfangfangia sp. LG-4]